MTAEQQNRLFTTSSKTVLSWTHREDTRLCDCRTAEQIVHRVLQDCPLLDTQRRHTPLSMQTSRTNSSPRPPRLSSPGHTEKTHVVTGGTNHRQAVGSCGRPAPHNPVPDCTWTGEGLGTDRSNAEEEEEEEEELETLMRDEVEHFMNFP